MDKRVYLLAKLVYLVELRQLASVVRHFEDYTRIMKRVERVCDNIEHDIGLSRPEEDTQLYRCLKCGSTWRSKEIIDGSAHDACGGLVFRVRG